MRVLTLKSTTRASAFVSKCFEQAMDNVWASIGHRVVIEPTQHALASSDLRGVVDIKINKPASASELS
jgi:hypothetical protein